MGYSYCTDLKPRFDLSLNQWERIIACGRHCEIASCILEYVKCEYKGTTSNGAMHRKPWRNNANSRHRVC